MIGSKSGLVIRTAFNNQGWAGRCKNPLNDGRCFKCVQGGLFINGGNPIYQDEKGYCKGDYIDYPLAGNSGRWCWEQDLCGGSLAWGNTKGKWRHVTVGMPVYFVYVELGGSLTLWGHSIIEEIDNEPDRYPPIKFKAFKPLSEDKWIRGLTGDEITGKKWGQLHYRYLDEGHEQYLASLVSGSSKRENIQKPIRPMESFENLNIELREDIREKLEKIADMEGRDTKELIREAVAKLIRERNIK